jgi:hypothetical protein
VVEGEADAAGEQLVGSGDRIFQSIPKPTVLFQHRSLYVNPPEAFPPAVPQRQAAGYALFTFGHLDPPSFFAVVGFPSRLRGHLAIAPCPFLDCQYQGNPYPALTRRTANFTI